MEKISQPAVRNYSSNISGLLGSSGVTKAIYPYANASLPDLKQSKRQSKCRHVFKQLYKVSRPSCSDQEHRTRLG